MGVRRRDVERLYSHDQWQQTIVMIRDSVIIIIIAHFLWSMSPVELITLGKDEDI